MRLNLTGEGKAGLRARVGWVLDVLRELLGERYREFRRHEVAAADFEELPRDCQDAILRAETLKAERRKSLVPFVEAAKNLIDVVVAPDHGKRQVESFATLSRRIRSWKRFKLAAKQWCERHSER
jgi:hypothetical protein